MSKKALVNNLIISTGSKQLDQHFNGGFVCGSLIGISGDMNSGKSNVARSFALNSLKAEDNLQRNFNKVFHISLDNSNDLEVYAAGLLNKEMEKISKNDIEIGLNQYKDRLIVKHNFGAYSDYDDFEFILMKTYQNFRFNVLVLDSSQLLHFDNFATAPFLNIYEFLKKIALKFDCVVFVPIQTYKNGSLYLPDYNSSRGNSFFDVLFSCKLDENGNLSLNVLKDKQGFKPNHKFLFSPDFSTRSWIED